MEKTITISLKEYEDMKYKIDRMKCELENINDNSERALKSCSYK